MQCATTFLPNLPHRNIATSRHHAAVQRATDAALFLDYEPPCNRAAAVCGAPGHEVASTSALRLHTDVEPMQMPAWIPDEENVMVAVEAAVAVAADIEEAAIGDGMAC